MQCAPIFDQCQVIWPDASSLQIMLEKIVCFAAGNPPEVQVPAHWNQFKYCNTYGTGKAEASYSFIFASQVIAKCSRTLDPSFSTKVNICGKYCRKFALDWH